MRPKKVKEILDDFHLVTIETAFVVRTFFFVTFGVIITLSSLLNLDIALISLCILAALYIIRFVFLKLFVQKDILPQLFIAPRGLITILLFFAIPDEYQNESFDLGILLYCIIISCVIMAVGLVASGKNVVPIEDMTFIYGSDKKEELESPILPESHDEIEPGELDDKTPKS